MGKYICHHEGKFFVWSTVVDAPVTYAMTREELENWHRDEYGREGMQSLPLRIERAMKNGCSSRDGMTLRDLVKGNRAGPREGEIGFAKIIALVNNPPEEAR